MTSQAESKTLTEIGPGTPMGNLMRQYWLPALKSGELAADGDPVRLMLLGEKLIAFRDTAGRVGVLDHRLQVQHHRQGVFRKRWFGEIERTDLMPVALQMLIDRLNDQLCL